MRDFMHSPVSLQRRLEARQRPQENSFMFQEWRKLLFLHWEYDSNLIQNTLPEGVFVDTYKGKSYLTINVFFIQNLRLSNFPAIPGFSDFIEVNFRTYVYDKNGIPGIWFYSLDINSLLAASSGKNFFSLPYHYSELTEQQENGSISIEGTRVEANHSSMKFSYIPENETYIAEPDSIDFFLMERYVLFTYLNGKLHLGRVHHLPYSISKAKVLNNKNHLFELNSFNAPLSPPNIIHYSSNIDVEIFKLKEDPFFSKEQSHL